MQASGFSKVQLGIPVVIAATVVMLLTYSCSLYLMPWGQRTMHSAVVDIRADIGAAILNEGDFNTPADGLTVFMRELAPDGHIRGILVHDNRDAQHPTTYLAETGMLAQTSAGGRLIMWDGNIEQTNGKGAQLSVLKFRRYVFDLDQFGNQQQDQQLEASDRYLSELFWPQFKTPPKNKNLVKVFLAEGNNRLAAPLYCLTFALLALAAVTSSRRQRGAYALRLTGVSIFAAVLRILGYGAQSMAARSPSLTFLMYLIPLLGAGLALLELQGGIVPKLMDRLRGSVVQPVPAT
jgi:lipopolysaccharide export system permease protein